MTEPVFLVIRRRSGVEHATVEFEHLPPAKDDFTRIWACRIDTLAPDYQLVFNRNRPIADMLASFARLRDLGQLPPPNLVSPANPDAVKRGRQLGDWWTPPVVPWDQAAPADPDYSGFAAAVPQC